MKHNSRVGMTMIELLVVISIIGVLLTLIIPSVGVYRRRAMTVKTSSIISNICLAMQNYHLDHRKYPSIDGSSDYYGTLNSLLYVALTGDVNKNMSIESGETKGAPYLNIADIALERDSDNNLSPFITDAFGRRIGYWPNPQYHNRTSFNLWSRGSNGTTGTNEKLGDDGKDDINNWR